MNGIKAGLQGFVGADAVLRFTAEGKPLVQVSVAVSDDRGPENERVQWVKVTLFGEQAEGLAPKLLKGTEVYAEGKLTLATWTTKDGSERSGLSLLAWQLVPMGRIGRADVGPPPTIRAFTNARTRRAERVP